MTVMPANIIAPTAARRSKIAPRDYQIEAIATLFSVLDEGTMSSPLVVAPTGAGKSLLVAMIVEEAARRAPDGRPRIVMATHVEELVTQNFQELMGYLPETQATICSAGLGYKNAHGDVVFGTVQTMVRRTDAIGPKTYVLIDEAHLVGKAESTQYARFIAAMRAHNPNAKIIGLTATPYRLDSGMLHEGDGAIFDGIAYEIEIDRLIREGYLVPPRTRQVSVKLDTTKVAVERGDYAEAAISEALRTQGVFDAALADTIEKGADRKGWLLFTATVGDAEDIATALSARGYPCAAIYGDMPKDQRRHLIAEFRAQRLRALASVNVLSIGFNAPHADLISCLRPTFSTGLWVQQVGRGLRLSPSTGKVDALVLDYVGNLGRHGPINALIIGNNAASTITCRACNHKGIPKGSRKCPSCGVALKDAEIPMRTCDECYEVYPKKLAACPACGTKPARPRTTAPIGATADTNSEILADLTALEAREWLPVSRVRSQVHNKPGKPPSFKVSYTVPGHQWPVNEFFCFEHGGVTARIAEVKWRRLGGRDPAPATASEANARAPGELRVPAMVRVREERGWPAIKGYRFNDDAS